MQSTTLIVPGIGGSGPGHWQTWIEHRIAGAVRVEQADWETPALGLWTEAVQRAIDRAPGEVWIVAHSFGCLASVVAARARAERVAGALLVAPADPERFAPDGRRTEDGGPASPSIAALMPGEQLGFPTLIVASRNDPWLRLTRAAWWAQRWGSRLVDLGNAGHINVDSGFGPWAGVLSLLKGMRTAHSGVPRGTVGGFPPSARTGICSA